MKNKNYNIIFGYISTLAVIAFMVWASCFPDPTTNVYRNNSSQSKKQKIGLSMPAKHLERWNHDGKKLKELLEKEGFEVELLFADNNALQQNNDIQNLIANGADLLLIAAVDADSLFAQIDEAVKKGIKVIAYNRPITNTSGITYLVTEDSFECGAEMGRFLEKKLNLTADDGKTYNIEIIGGDPADKNALILYNGQMSILDKYIDAGKLIIPSGQRKFEEICTNGWSSDLAQKRFQNLLSSYYTDNKKLDAVVTACDSLMIAVMKSLETDYKGTNNVFVTGQDGEDSAFRMIVEGKSVMTIFKNVEKNAVLAVELIKNIFQSNNFEPEEFCKSFPFKCSFDDKNFNNGKINVPTFLIDCDTVTAENYKEILVDTGLYKMGINGFLEKIKH